MVTQKSFHSVVLEDGTKIQVQTTSLSGGVQKVSGFKHDYPFEVVSQSIEKISKSLIKSIKKASPNKATVQFGVEFGLKEGQLTAFLVQGTTTANLTVTLEWVKEATSKKRKK